VCGHATACEVAALRKTALAKAAKGEEKTLARRALNVASEEARAAGRLADAAEASADELPSALRSASKLGRQDGRRARRHRCSRCPERRSRSRPGVRRGGHRP
jgi:hypothetical protein